MNNPIVKLEGISKAFTGNRVLYDIDLEVYPGESLCLAGENGSGKSTIIKIISGVHTYDKGMLSLNGKNYKKVSSAQSIKEGIQVIYQDFSLFPNLTIAENIVIGQNVHLKHKRMNWKNARKVAKETLARIGVEMDVDLEVGILPVAQKQIVAISRAISQEAKLIIMDEPTTALTGREIRDLLDIVRSLKEQGVAVIFVSHKLEEIFEACDRIFVIRNGEKVIDESLETFPKEKLGYYMTGKEIAEEPFEFIQPENKKTLEVRNISYQDSYKDVSFSVNAGEILAITGQLGSGRTELATSLFGITPVSKGEIFIDGKEVKIKSRKDALDNHIAYLPEDRLSEGLFLTRAIGENFASAIIDKMSNKIGIIDDKSLKKQADYWMEHLSMTVKPHDAMASVFSGGNQQRIVLGKWLAAEPKIFILNGPTVGVDVKSKSEIHDIMKRLANQGLIIIMISDDVGEIFTTANRVIVMNDGKIAYEGNTKDISHEELYDKIIADEKTNKP